MPGSLHLVCHTPNLIGVPVFVVFLISIGVWHSTTPFTVPSTHFAHLTLPTSLPSLPLHPPCSPHPGTLPVPLFTSLPLSTPTPLFPLSHPPHSTHLTPLSPTPYPPPHSPPSSTPLYHLTPLSHLPPLSHPPPTLPTRSYWSPFKTVLRYCRSWLTRTSAGWTSWVMCVTSKRRSTQPGLENWRDSIRSVLHPTLL